MFPVVCLYVKLGTIKWKGILKHTLQQIELRHSFVLFGCKHTNIQHFCVFIERKGEAGGKGRND